MFFVYLISIAAIALGIYEFRKTGRKSYHVVTGLGVIFLIVAGICSYADSQPAPYYKLGTPISKVKADDDAKSHAGGDYYTIDGRNYVRYYHTINGNNKDVVSAVKFNYYESDDTDNVSQKQLLKDYRKVTASDLKETSNDHYYSKKTGQHYFSEEEHDVDGVSQGIIHLTANELN